MLESIRAFMAMGGPVMWPLAGVSLLLWYFIIERHLILRRGSRTQLDKLLGRPVPKRPSGVIPQLIDRINRLRAKGQDVGSEEFPLLFRRQRLAIQSHHKVIDTLVASAPLLGLLGTVNGMIETFDSMVTMSMFTAEGGIAVGISRALVTTEYGLGIAIPGLIAARILDRSEAMLDEEIDRLALMFCPAENRDGGAPC